MTATGLALAGESSSGWNDAPQGRSDTEDLKRFARDAFGAKVLAEAAGIVEQGQSHAKGHREKVPLATGGVAEELVCA